MEMIYFPFSTVNNLFGAQIGLSAWARVSENLQSAANYRKCSRLGSELRTFNDGILSKLLFQLVKKRFNLH